MSTAIIFDLDYTLLDTAQFKESLAEAVIAYGPSRNAYEDAYKATVTREGRVYDYDPDAHLALLSKEFPDAESLAAARRAISEVLTHTEDFLYPDAKELLKELRGRGANLTLLTLGNEKWQHLKIDHSGLRDYFDAVVATDKEKTGVLASLIHQGDRTIVINDNGKEIAEMRAHVPEPTYMLKRGPKPVPEGLGIREANTIRELAGALAEETGWEIDIERQRENREMPSEIRQRRPDVDGGRSENPLH